MPDAQMTIGQTPERKFGGVLNSLWGRSNFVGLSPPSPEDVGRYVALHSSPPVVKSARLPSQVSKQAFNGLQAEKTEDAG